MVAVPPQGAQRTHLWVRPKAALEQAKGVQLLEPGRVAHVGLLLEVAGQTAGIDDQDLEALRFQEIAPRHSGDTRRFEDDGRDGALFEPRHESTQIGGEDAEGTDGLRVAISRHGDDVRLAADIDAGSVGMNDLRRGAWGTLLVGRHTDL